MFIKLLSLVSTIAIAGGAHAEINVENFSWTQASGAFEMSVEGGLKLTGILVSHEIPRIFGIVQKVAMLHEGRIIAVEPPDLLCASPEPTIQQFVNGRAEGILVT